MIFFDKIRLRDAAMNNDRQTRCQIRAEFKIDIEFHVFIYRGRSFPKQTKAPVLMQTLNQMLIRYIALKADLRIVKRSGWIGKNLKRNLFVPVIDKSKLARTAREIKHRAIWRFTIQMLGRQCVPSLLINDFFDLETPFVQFLLHLRHWQNQNVSLIVKVNPFRNARGIVKHQRRYVMHEHDQFDAILLTVGIDLVNQSLLPLHLHPGRLLQNHDIVNRQ